MPLEAKDHKRIGELGDLAGTLRKHLDGLMTPPGGAGERTNQERRAFRMARDAAGEAQWRLERIAEGRIDKAGELLPRSAPETKPLELDDMA